MTIGYHKFFNILDKNIFVKYLNASKHMKETVESKVILEGLVN